MTYRVRIASVAMRQMEDFAAYLGEYDEVFAVKQFERLDDVLAVQLGKSPLTWAYFSLTGSPYRAFLFRVGRRTQYWIIYTVDEPTRTVDVLQFWNAGRDPQSLDL